VRRGEQLLETPNERKTIKRDRTQAAHDDVAIVLDVQEGIRQGLDDARKGRVREARAFFHEFEAVQGLNRLRKA
jgi:hypothetical protein